MPSPRATSRNPQTSGSIIRMSWNKTGAPGTCGSPHRPCQHRTDLNWSPRCTWPLVVQQRQRKRAGTHPTSTSWSPAVPCLMRSNHSTESGLGNCATQQSNRCTPRSGHTIAPQPPSASKTCFWASMPAFRVQQGISSLARSRTATRLPWSMSFKTRIHCSTASSIGSTLNPTPPCC